MSPTKILIALVILLGAIIGVSLFTNQALASSANRIEKHIESIEKNAKDQNWHEAREELVSVEKAWHSTEKVWTLLLDHFEIDNIGTSLARMSNYIKSEDRALTLGEAASLKKYVRHIPEKEAFSLRNIF